MEGFEKFLPTLLVVLVIFFVVLIVISSIRRTVRKVKRKVNNILDINNIGRAIGLNQYGVNASDLLNAMNDARTEPEVKSVGGMTNMYLGKIQKEFPNYHNNEVENIIKNTIQEYLEILSGKRSDFSKNVSERFKTTKGSIQGTITNIKYNSIAIYNYIKASDYATVIYRCSVGYDLNGSRVETRFEVDYSYELASEKNENIGLVCPVCGGKYDSIHDTKCPYCGALVVKDTYMNWFVTNIQEI